MDLVGDGDRDDLSYLHSRVSIATTRPSNSTAIASPPPSPTTLTLTTEQVELAR